MATVFLKIKKVSALFTILLLFYSIFGFIESTLSIFVSAQQINIELNENIGPELLIECTVDFQPTETHLSHRWLFDTGDLISENDRLVVPDESSRYLLARDGYTLNIKNLLKSDEGRYRCQINYKEGDDSPVYTAEGIANVFVLNYLPPVEYPKCELLPPSPYLVGATTSFSCSVEQTNAEITTQMTLHRSDRTITPLNTPTGTAYTITLSEDDDGAEFQCTMTSPTFPTASRTCSIGPISVARPTTEAPVKTTAVSFKTTPVVQTSRVVKTSPSVIKTSSVQTNPPTKPATTKVASLSPDVSTLSSPVLLTTLKTTSSVGFQNWPLVGGIAGAFLLLLVLIIILWVLTAKRSHQKPSATRDAPVNHIYYNQTDTTASRSNGEAIQIREDHAMDNNNIYGSTPLYVNDDGNGHDDDPDTDEETSAGRSKNHLIKMPQMPENPRFVYINGDEG